MSHKSWVEQLHHLTVPGSRFQFSMYSVTPAGIKRNKDNKENNCTNYIIRITLIARTISSLAWTSLQKRKLISSRISIASELKWKALLRSFESLSSFGIVKKRSQSCFRSSLSTHWDHSIMVCFISSTWEWMKK